MNLNNLNNAANAANAVKNLRSLEENIKNIKNSKLNENIKNGALKEVDKMKKSMIILSVIFSIFFVLLGPMSYFMFKNLGFDDDSSMIYTVLIAIICILIFTVAIIFYFRKITPTYRKALKYINNFWDALSEEEISQLVPNREDNKIIKKYNRAYLKWCIVWIAIIVSYIFLLGINLENGINLLLFILILIISIPYYIKLDSLEVTRKFLKSGAYKRMYHCANCNMDISILRDNDKKICPHCNGNIVKIDLLETPEYKEELKGKKLTIYTIILFSLFLLFNFIFVAPAKPHEKNIGKTINNINTKLDEFQDDLNESDTNNTDNYQYEINESVNNAKDASSNIKDILEKMKDNE